MSKSNKVKRYKKIYNDPHRKRKKVMKSVAIVAAGALLIFVGYSAYSPLMSFLNGEMTYDVSKDYPSVAAVSSRPVSADSDNTSVNGTTINTINTPIQGVCVPTTTVKDVSAFEIFLADAKAKEYNAIILEAKDSTGMVQYQSAVPQVAEAAAQAPDAYPLAERITSIKSAGLKPVVRVFAFEDNTASRVLKDSFVMYRGSTDYRWLDNSAEAGGRGWLSPESAVAQGYITAISEEITTMGCETLLMASFQFPTGLGTNLAYSGPQSDANKMAVLQAYATTLTQALSAKKATCYLETPATSILNGDDVRYGGNPMDIGFKKLAPEIYPSALPAPFTVGTETIPVPKDAPYDATKLAITQIQSMTTGKVDELLPLLQSFDSYEIVGVAEQERALTEAGIKEYILYNSTGTYP